MRPSDRIHDLAIAAVSDFLVREFARVREFFCTFDDGQWATSFLGLPVNFLIDLAVALRFRAWEDQGVWIHLEAGLPNSAVALRLISVEATAAGKERRSPISLFGEQIYRAILDRFLAIESPRFAGTIRTVVENDDEVIDRLASFLWAARRK